MNSSTIIGREEELATISRLYESDRSEFLALYGRRRVGKSFLIEEALENKFTFIYDIQLSLYGFLFFSKVFKC